MGKYFTSEYKKILDALDNTGSNLPSSANEVADFQRTIGENCKSAVNEFLNQPIWRAEAKGVLTQIWTNMESLLSLALTSIGSNLVKAATLAVPTLRDYLKDIKDKEEQLTMMELELEGLKREQQSALTRYNNADNSSKISARVSLDNANIAVSSKSADIDNMVSALGGLVNKANNTINQIRGLETAFSQKVTVTTTTASNMGLGSSGFYSLGDVGYQVVDIKGFGSLGEFANMIRSNGIMNLGPYGAGQCFNYSMAYGGFILGDSGVKWSDNPANDLRFRQYNSRPFKLTRTTDEADALGTIQRQLDAGKPVVIRIYSKSKGETHYGLAVGYNKSAKGRPLRETDILFIDSYDGKIEQLGTARKLNGWRGSIFIHTPGYSFRNGDEKRA